MIDLNILTKALDLIDQKLKPLPSINFDIIPVKERSSQNIIESKLGGAPWWPATKPYPKDSNNKKMFLLTQLNFDHLPKVENFPTTGLLQIFISENDCYGMNWDNPTDQSNFRVVYHKEYDITKTINTYNYCVYDKKYRLPFYKEYLLKANEVSNMKIDAYDYRFNELLVKYYKELSNTDIDEDELFLDLEVLDKTSMLYDRSNRHTAFIGGYPIFTQDDPRFDKKFQKHKILLFELDSEYSSKNSDINIMWGDSGTGSFFITKKDLQNLDFSNVLYNFDCC